VLNEPLSDCAEPEIHGVTIMIKKHRKTSKVPDALRPRHQTSHEEVITLLDEWLQDESGYDEETWPELKEALDRDRLSERKLFDV
jgi:hypothetical protein